METKEYQKPICSGCLREFEKLGVWVDEGGKTAIFFCVRCGMAFSAQLLKLMPEE